MRFDLRPLALATAAVATLIFGGQALAQNYPSRSDHPRGAVPGRLHHRSCRPHPVRRIGQIDRAECRDRQSRRRRRQRRNGIGRTRRARRLYVADGHDRHAFDQPGRLCQDQIRSDRRLRADHPVRHRAECSGRQFGAAGEIGQGIDRLYPRAARARSIMRRPATEPPIISPARCSCRAKASKRRTFPVAAARRRSRICCAATCSSCSIIICRCSRISRKENCARSRSPAPSASMRCRTCR